MITANNIYFEYKKGKSIINDFSCPFESGKIYALIGHNGAGKTTLLRIFMNILKPTKGSISVEKNIKFSYVPDYGGLYNMLTVRENLYIFIRLANIQIHINDHLMDKYLQDWSLTHRKDAIVSTLSMGERQRLSLIVAGLNDPDIIVLDEPSNSVDIVTQDLLNHYLIEFKENNKTVIMATHDINLIEKVCDEIIIIDNHEIKFIGKIKEIENFTDLYSRYTHGGYNSND